jgi:hypothetical protein
MTHTKLLQYTVTLLHEYTKPGFRRVPWDAHKEGGLQNDRFRHTQEERVGGAWRRRWCAVLVAVAVAASDDPRAEQRQQHHAELPTAATG